MSTTCIKAKCTSCGLHFAAYSWDPDWRPQFCPECGARDGFMIWQADLPKEIFAYVPGDAALIEMT